MKTVLRLSLLVLLIAVLAAAYREIVAAREAERAAAA